MVDPTALVVANRGVCGTLVVTEELGVVNAGPAAGRAVACAELTMRPASTSVWATTYVALHTTDDPGANVVVGQEMADSPTSGSMMTSELSVTFPKLDTLNW